MRGKKNIYIYKNMYIVYMYSLLCTYICEKRQKAVYLTTFVVGIVLLLSQRLWGGYGQ